MRPLIPLLALPAALTLGGCLSTIGTIVTAPVKIAAKTADWATTSQDEADRNRGRAYRKAEGKAQKDCRREVEGYRNQQDCVSARLRAEGYN
jgi:hypothetical protein